MGQEVAVWLTFCLIRVESPYRSRPSDWSQHEVIRGYGRRDMSVCAPARSFVEWYRPPQRRRPTFCRGAITSLHRSGGGGRFFVSMMCRVERPCRLAWSFNRLVHNHPCLRSPRRGVGASVRRSCNSGGPFFFADQVGSAYLVSLTIRTSTAAAAVRLAASRSNYLHSYLMSHSFLKNRR